MTPVWLAPPIKCNMAADRILKMTANDAALPIILTEHIIV